MLGRSGGTWSALSWCHTSAPSGTSASASKSNEKGSLRPTAERVVAVEAAITFGIFRLRSTLPMFNPRSCVSSVGSPSPLAALGFAPRAVVIAVPSCTSAPSGRSTSTGGRPMEHLREGG